jgi:hypothetical protein
MPEPQPHFNAHWKDWEGCTFLGTEKNPKTGKIYDYWIVSSSSDSLSWTCKHGNEDHEYGSGSIQFLGVGDFSINSLKMIEHDYLFGIIRAKYFALLYLAVKSRPLIECEC